MSFHLVTRLLAVVDLLEGDGLRGEEVAQFGQIDAVSKPLLQLCGGRQLLIQTGLHPSARRAQQQTSHIIVVKEETYIYKPSFPADNQDSMSRRFYFR